MLCISNDRSPLVFLKDRFVMMLQSIRTKLSISAICLVFVLLAPGVSADDSLSPLDALQRPTDEVGFNDSLPPEIVGILGEDLGRHANAGKCIAISHDQKWIASGSRDLTVRVWEATTLKEVRKYSHGDDVDAVYFHKDGKHLLTVCWDGAIRIFDIHRSADRPVFELQVEPNQIETTLLASESLLYVSKANSRRDRSLPISIEEYSWSGPELKTTGRVLSPLFTLNNSPPDLCVSEDGKWLISAVESLSDQQGWITYWNLQETNTKPALLQVFTDQNVTALAFDTKRSRLVAGGARGGRSVADLTSKTSQILRADGTEQICTIEVLEGFDEVYFGGMDSLIQRYEWNDDKLESRDVSKGHSDWVQDIVFSSTAAAMYSIGWEGTVRRWNRNGKSWSLVPLEGHLNSACSIAFSRDSHWIATGSTTKLSGQKPANDVFLWRLSGTKFVLDRALKGAYGYVRSLSFSADGKLLVAADDKSLIAWQLDKEDQLKSFKRQVKQDEDVINLSAEFVEILAESHVAIAGWNYGHVNLVDFSKDEPIELDSWTAPFHYVESIAVAANGSHAFVSSIPLQIANGKLSQVVDSDELQNSLAKKESPPQQIGGFLKYEPVTQLLNPVRLSRDNRFLIGGNRRGELTILDATSKAERTPRKVQGHETVIEAIDFGGDNKLASGDWNGAVRLWDFENSNKPISEIRLSRVWSLKFSPDGRHLAIGCGNGIVYIARVLPQKPSA